MSESELSSYPMPEWSSVGAIEKALEAIRLCTDKNSANDACHRLLYALGNDHAGIYFPVAVPLVRRLGELLELENSWARTATLDVLVDLCYSFWPDPQHYYMSLPDGTTVDTQFALRGALRKLRPKFSALAESNVATSAEKTMASEMLERIDQDDHWISFDLEAAHAAAAAVNEKLKPIAESPVDTSDPEWEEKLRRLEPLDVAGVRTDAESLLLSLLEVYASGTVEQRAAIRELFRQNRAFAWATHVRQPATTAEGLRLRLLNLSVLSETEDPRDIMMCLKDLHQMAETAGLKIGPIALEVALLSTPSLGEILLKLR